MGVVATVVLASVALVLLVAVVVKRIRHVRLMESFPGRRAVPLLGNVIQMGQPLTTEPFQFIRECVLEFKRAYRLWVGPWSLLVLCHPETIKAVLSRDTPKAWNYRFFETFLGTKNLFALHTHETDELHKKLRRIHTPMFHFGKLKTYMKDYVVATKTLLSKWDSRVGETIGLENEMGLLSLDVILRSAFGYVSECQHKEVPYLQHVHALTGNLMRRTYKILEWPDFVYGRTKRGKADAQHSAAVLEFGLNLIHQRRAALEEARADGSLNPETEDSHPLTQDFLGQFMAHDGSISDEEIASAVNGIVFAAHDTTGCVLSFAIHALGRMPHLQDKIREEVLSVAGEEMVTLDDLPKLQYTQQFIQETMRMYPPGPLLGRTLDDDAMIEGRMVPKSQWIEIGVWAVHHNPEVWSDPETFDPDRFSPENKAKQTPFSYLPFSAGSRNCLGQRYAMMEMKTVISSLMQRYYIRNDPKSPKPEVINNVVLSAKIPLSIVLEARQQRK